MGKVVAVSNSRNLDESTRSTRSGKPNVSEVINERFDALSKTLGGTFQYGSH